MDILNTKSLECNRQIKINFDGGDLSSDAGLLLIKEFVCKLGFIKILQSMFKTNDTASFRYHKADENLWQMIYRMDETTLEQFYNLIRRFHKVVYTIKKPEIILLDLDSTLLDTYGNQEGKKTCRKVKFFLCREKTLLFIVSTL